MRLTRTGRNPLTQAAFAQVDSAGGMLQVLVDMIVEDDHIMSIVDTMQSVVDRVVAENAVDGDEDARHHPITRSNFTHDLVDEDGEPLEVVNFEKITYHDRGEDWGKVGAAATGFVQHADKAKCFRSDKTRTKAWCNAFKTFVQKVIPISQKPTPESMKKCVDPRARLWAGWESAPDTIDFYNNLKRLGLHMRKKSLCAQRLFAFNRTHMASYNPTDGSKPFYELGDYLGADPIIAIQAMPGFKTLSKEEKAYITSKPFLDKVWHEVETHGELRDEFIRDDPNLTSEAAKVCVYCVVCMCACVCVCMCVCMCACACMCVCVHGCMHACAARVYVHVCMCMHVCMYAWVHVCVYVRRARVCVCMCVHVHMSPHIHALGILHKQGNGRNANPNKVVPTEKRLGHAH